MNVESCLIVAGEKSGEDHAMSFFTLLRAKDPSIQYFGVGGDELQKNGMELLYHIKDFSTMGITDVLFKLPFFLKATSHIINEVKKRNCKTAILIDFQDFNFRLAKKLKKLGVEVLYYVAPQAWAWREYRAYLLGKIVNTLFTILPFEKKWFMARGVKNVKGVIHPVYAKYKDELKGLQKNKIGKKLKLVVLPGSRNTEVKLLLPDFVKTIELLKKEIEVETHIVTTSSVNRNLYLPFLSQIDYEHSSYDLIDVLKNSDIALAASGTVTLITGLFKVPTIVCYKATLVNEFIFRLLVPYRGPISLTNIIYGDYIFPEFLQRDVNPIIIKSIINKWYRDEDTYKTIIDKLSTLGSKISGDDFSISDYIFDVIKNK